jgi:hypothetical protein
VIPHRRYRTRGEGTCLVRSEAADPLNASNRSSHHLRPATLAWLWPERHPSSLHCFPLHRLVSYTARRPTLLSHCLRKDVVCPTCLHLTSSSPSSTHLGRPSPSGTLFCSTRRSGGRIARCVLPYILSFILTNPLVSGSPSPVHSGKCWVRPPDPFNSVVGCTPIPFIPVQLLARVHLTCR